MRSLCKKKKSVGQQTTRLGRQANAVFGNYPYRVLLHV